MTSLIRDVIFPSAAAIGLLAAVITDPAVADESYYDEPAVAVAVAAPVTMATNVLRVVEPVVPTVPARTSPTAEAHSENASSNGIEPRCDRTGRIGKFKITRCD